MEVKSRATTYNANGYDLKSLITEMIAKDGVGFSDASAAVEQVGKTGIVTYDSDGILCTNGPGLHLINNFSMDKDFDNGVMFLQVIQA